MSDKRRDIDREWLLFYAAKKLGDINGRTSAVSGDQRSYTHANEILGSRQSVDRFNVRVHVDEPRGNYLVTGVDCLPCIRWIHSAKAHDAPILNTHIRTKPGIATTIYNPRVCDQQIESRRTNFAAVSPPPATRPGRREQGHK